MTYEQEKSIYNSKLAAVSCITGAPFKPFPAQIDWEKLTPSEGVRGQVARIVASR